jgi:hypothetical protein
LCFLEWLRGLDLNQRPSGYENGVSNLGSLILRDLAPGPAARLLSQICPSHSCAFATLSGPQAGWPGLLSILLLQFAEFAPTCALTHFGGIGMPFARPRTKTNQFDGGSAFR